MECIFQSDGMYISKKKHVLDMLKRANVLEAKPYSSPVITSSRLSKDSGELLTDVIFYWS